MTALAIIAALFIGTAIGFFEAAIMAAGKREDECRQCHRSALDAAFREADGRDGGTE